MSTASAKVAKKPPRVVVLSPSAFSDEYNGKPSTDVAIGLRFVSERTLRVARAMAAREAVKAFTTDESDCVDQVDRVQHYNDALMSYAVALATTDPNDVSVPYFVMAEDLVPVALTSEGIRRLWDELSILHRGSNVSIAPLDDEDRGELVRLLADGRALAAMPSALGAQVRRLLAYCLEQIALTAPNLVDAPAVASAPDWKAETTHSAPAG